jgi:hypothetical protein
VCVCVCVVRPMSLRLADPSSSPTDCLSVFVCDLENLSHEAALARVGLLRKKKRIHLSQITK